jgi:hypothetical protein
MLFFKIKDRSLRQRAVFDSTVIVQPACAMMPTKPNFRDQTLTMENPIDTPRLPRKRRSLAQELVTVLSEQIRDGLLKRGDKLPTESAIMEAHGVSRTVVREAISRLQAAGQVETRHGIGTFVLDTPSPSGFRIDPATRHPA